MRWVRGEMTSRTDVPCILNGTGQYEVVQTAGGGVVNSPNISTTSLCFESVYEVPPPGFRSLRRLSSRATILNNQAGGRERYPARTAVSRTCDPPHTAVRQAHRRSANTPTMRASPP